MVSIHIMVKSPHPHNMLQSSHYGTARERSDSVVQCLTRDRGAAGSSLTGVTALWSLSKTHYSSLVLVQPRKTRPCLTERLLMGHKESNQTNKQNGTVTPSWYIHLNILQSQHHGSLNIFLQQHCYTSYVIVQSRHLGTVTTS